MNILVEIVVSILTAYLAFTTMLAGHVSNFLDIFSTEQGKTEEIKEGTMVQLPSIFNTSIPDILLRSSEYQAAALSTAPGQQDQISSDPISALVNIFCTFETAEYIRTTTGTGFFIDQAGVIMTNAHIAQFLLLEKTESFGKAACTVRVGSPATARYTAELLYIPPAWIKENASLIDDAAPMGTGERDYALLYVNGDVEGWPLPERFPSLSFDDNLLPTSVKQTAVSAVGYPADNLLLNGVKTDLLAKLAPTSISELYTFGSNYADVFSVKGSAVGAQGSSGGPIVNEKGDVIGVIATRGDDEVDGAGSLRAITLSHISRTIQEETGFSLAENISGDLPYKAEVFATTMTPFLLTTLEENRN